MRAYFVSKKHIELDLHGMTVEEARKYLDLSIAINQKDVEEIIVIHGYRKGHFLKDFVQKEFKSDYVSRKFLWMNPGITSLIIKSIH
ncbi:MAG TPA: Smr/MutS family protein [Tissierellaceae bacterium]|nr:Smr/MutS family protein [Tissierellaceae bacterium]